MRKTHDHDYLKLLVKNYALRIIWLSPVLDACDGRGNLYDISSINHYRLCAVFPLF